MVKNTVQLWFTVGYLNYGTLQLSWLRTTKVPQHGLAPHQVTLIPVSNEKHVDYAWEVAKNLVTVVSKGRGWTQRKMQFKIRVSNQQDSYQLIVGDKGNGRRNSQCSSLWTKRKHKLSQLMTFVQAILADIANKSRVEKVNTFENQIQTTSTSPLAYFKYSLRPVS